MRLGEAIRSLNGERRGVVLELVMLFAVVTYLFCSFVTVNHCTKKLHYFDQTFCHEHKLEWHQKNRTVPLFCRQRDLLLRKRLSVRPCSIVDFERRRSISSQCSEWDFTEEFSRASAYTILTRSIGPSRHVHFIVENVGMFAPTKWENMDAKYACVKISLNSLVNRCNWWSAGVKICLTMWFGARSDNYDNNYLFMFCKRTWDILFFS